MNESMKRMQVGVVLMPTDPWSTSVDRAQTLERQGFDHLWVYDHFAWRQYRDRWWFAALPWLTGIAASTSNIRIGTLVASPTLRHPLALAREAMTIDHISNGRFILGIGAGGAGYDATIMGDEPLTPKQRVDRFDEYLYLVDSLLRGELHNHQGRHYSIDEGRVIPGCVQQPRLPLAIAAGAKRSLGLAAQRGDWWITLGDTSPAGTEASHTKRLLDFRDQYSQFDQLCQADGRDAATITKAVFISSTDTVPMVSPAALFEYMEALADIGFNTVIVHDSRSDDSTIAGSPEVIGALADWLAASRSRAE